MRRRAPKLTAERVEGIALMIRAWEGRLTWNGICDAVQQSIGARYTRQALGNHLPICAAYAAHTSGPKPTTPDRPPETASQKRIRLLETEIRERMQLEDRLLEKLARWAHNASSRGLDEDFLDREVPMTSRAGNR